MKDSPSFEDLLAWFAKGNRSEENFRLGLEYEMFLTDSSGNPLPFEGERGVEEVLNSFAARTGWLPQKENGRVLGLESGDGRNLSLEPGAQVEFNSSPCSLLGELDQEFREMLGHFQAVTKEFQILFLGLGSQPVASSEEIKRIPKARYEILEPWLEDAGELGLWMMKATCGTQVNFDYSGPEDAAKKMRVALGLAPILNAMFANSPLRAGKPSGFVSWRGHVWSKTDPSRCGWIPECVQENSTIEDYAQWALDVPMLFVERRTGLQDMRGHSFRDYWQSGDATMEDWNLHLSTLFPEARFRPQLELRSIDGGSPSMAMALCALVQGIFYSETALNQAWALVADWSNAEREQLWHDAHRLGLKASHPAGRPLLDYAYELLSFVDLSEEDRAFLSPLEDVLSSGCSEGEELLRLWEGEWGGQIHPLLRAVACFK